VIKTRKRLIGATFIAAGVAVAAEPLSDNKQVAPSNLCVTEGVITPQEDGWAAVDVPKMRAYVNGLDADTAELRFVYLGPSHATESLASGAARAQLGLKLRAADPCNLLYVMWRIEPRAELVVSLKSNPGDSLSSQCGNHGYRNLRAQTSAALPGALLGRPHILRADIRAGDLSVVADGHLVWRGRLDATAAGLAGPVGVRSDNARFEFILATAVAPTSHTERSEPCRQRADPE
jgi:hypothetical protein